jgi:hypothetical protein
MAVRIALTKTLISFTPRGKAVGFYKRGFIRRHGKTISGVAYNGGPEWVFYPDGANKDFAYSSFARQQQLEYPASLYASV